MVTESFVINKEADLKVREIKKNVGFFETHTRLFMSGVLMLADLGGLAVAILIAIQLRILHVMILEHAYVELYALLAVILVVSFYTRGLYPAVGLNKVEELRHIVVSLNFGFLALLGLTFILQTSGYYSRLVLILTWMVTLVTIPLFRYIARKVSIHLNLWGEPVAIIGDLHKALPLAGYFKRQLEFGVRPVAVLRDEECKSEDFKNYPSLPIYKIKEYAKSLSLSTVLIVVNDLNHVDAVVDRYRYVFQRVVLIKYQQGRYGLNKLKPLDFSDVLGLQVKHNLLSVASQLYKRLADLIIASVGLVLLSPFFGLLVLLIKLDSKGGVFYRQVRLGREGEEFNMLKFRTMYKDADDYLKKELEINPEMKKEWDQYQKLKKDPRITRMGGFLRKFSLDELPQLWNVLIGEMSLVGPRPILVNQRSLYGESFKDYIQVAPGMSGLWQISGRNQTTFTRRADLDNEYIQRWSLWLDVYILLKTFKIVIFQDGAY
jgi:Undecaprenyl-phosphate galactose phosphotransferase WbaP